MDLPALCGHRHDLLMRTSEMRSASQPQFFDSFPEGLNSRTFPLLSLIQFSFTALFLLDFFKQHCSDVFLQ
jgi:hypothetical protein